MSVFPAFFKLVASEWLHLSAAPFAFASVSVIAFGGAFAALRWQYESRIQIGKDRIEDLSERLKAKEVQLSEYRQQLEITPSVGSKYSVLSNPALAAQAEKLVKKIRSWLVDVAEGDQRASGRERENLNRAASDVERAATWKANTDQMGGRIQTLMRDYERHFKTDAILLRDEMAARLPAGNVTGIITILFESPTNPIGIQKIVDDLEEKAKSLP